MPFRIYDKIITQIRYIVNLFKINIIAIKLYNRIMDVIGRIERLRAQRGWTINKMAYEAALSQSSVASMYERNTPPKIEMLQSLCDAFEISLAQFFSEGEETEVITADEKRLIEKYRALSKRKRQAVLELITNEN